MTWHLLSARPRRMCLFVAALALLYGSPVRAAETYRVYTNARFGYTLEYPVSLLAAGPEADNGDGRRFESRDRKILLRAFGSYNTGGETLGDRLRSVAADWRGDGAHITYHKLGPGWYALSGFVGNDIFYEKALLRNGTFATLIWEYSKTVRRRLDTPVTRAIRSFKFVAPTRDERNAAPRLTATPRPIVTPRPIATARAIATPRPTPPHHRAAHPPKTGSHGSHSSSEGY